MDPKIFAKLALALIEQASFPGTDEAADQIKQYRWTCRCLINGTMVLADPAPPAPPAPPPAAVAPPAPPAAVAPPAQPAA